MSSGEQKKIYSSHSYNKERLNDLPGTIHNEPVLGKIEAKKEQIVQPMSAVYVKSEIIYFNPMLVDNEVKQQLIKNNSSLSLLLAIGKR